MLIHFAHANGIPAASYKPLFEQLFPHTVIYNPQFGHNPDFPVTDNWHSLADELIDYLASEAGEPVVAVGHSMGAIISFLAYCKRPELFRGVLMLDPPLMWGALAWSFRVAKFLGKGDNITPAGKSKHRRRRWDDREQAIAYFASKKLFQFEPSCFASFCEAAIKPAQDGGVELAFEVDIEVAIFRTTPHNLRSCNPPPGVPIKVTYGRQSDASMAQCIEPFCKYFGIDHEVIDGEHMYPLQQPQLTVKLIEDFLSGIQS